MRRRSTTRINKHCEEPHLRRLRARVTSPRIRLFRSLQALKVLSLLLVVAAGLYGLQLGLREGWKNLFHENPDYLLQEITVDTNGSLGVEWVKEIAEIQPNNTVFSIELDKIREKLTARPEIISADVQKRLPGTLDFTLVERIPAVWVSCQELSLVPRDRDSGLLADSEGQLFRCEGAMWDYSEHLPVIEIKAPPADSEFTIQAGSKLTRRGSLAALSLAGITTAELPAVTPRAVRISEENEFSLTVEFDDRSEATFGFFDHQRQLADFRRIWQHAAENGRQLASVNLIPTRNIPVNFRSPAPRRAIIIEE